MVQQNLIARGCRLLYRNFREWQSQEAKALRRLKKSIGHLPCFKPGKIRICGWDLEFVDAASCISGFDYIVVRKWNDFTTRNPSPRILDCGANIGISVLNYKRLFPNARITAFEPDPQICEVLRRNLCVNGAGDVEVIEAALWDDEGDMYFQPDGADGGRLVKNIANNTCKLVRTERLSRYLNGPVDLVKMDIEGAELKVLLDSVDLLKNVKQLIVEHHSFINRPQRLGELIWVLEKSGFRIQINNTRRWINSLVQSPVMGPIEQLLMIYGTTS